MNSLLLDILGDEETMVLEESVQQALPLERMRYYTPVKHDYVLSRKHLDPSIRDFLGLEGEHAVALPFLSQGRQIFLLEPTILRLEGEYTPSEYRIDDVAEVNLSRELQKELTHLLGPQIIDQFRVNLDSDLFIPTPYKA